MSQKIKEYMVLDEASGPLTKKQEKYLLEWAKQHAKDFVIKQTRWHKNGLLFKNSKRLSKTAL